MTAPFFITSSGTDIGKTLITTALCWQLRERGKKVTALKPVITGFDSNDVENDTGLILKSCGLTPTPELIETISPWRFRAPLAPNLAAAKEGKRVDVQAVAAFCRDHEKLSTDVLLVEGSGGVMAPLDDTQTILDLMQMLGWPAIVVVGSYLGALSHTLTAIEVLRSRKIPIRALVISESDHSDVSLNETVDGLAHLVPNDIPVVKLPRSREKVDVWKHLPNISWICQ